MKTIILTALLVLITLTFFTMPMRANAQDDNTTIIALKASLPELTAEEKAQSIAKYYFEAIPEPDKTHMARMDSPSDAMKAIYPEQISDLLNPGDLDIAPASPALMCHFFRETPDGVEQRTLFWLGYHLVDGEPELVLPPGVKIPEAATQGLARHNVAEYSRLRDLLPRLYTELGGKITY